MNKIKSELEEGVVAVLTKARAPLPLTEIIRRMDDSGFTIPSGETPSKSLYATLFRRERRRRESGEPTLFVWKLDSDRILQLSLTRSTR